MAGIEDWDYARSPSCLRVDPHADLVRRFYDAFARRDAEGMAACYHPDVVFRDPVFGELKGRRAADMWRMLVARADSLQVEARNVKADEREGSARWVARYRFGKAKRPVANEVEARFAFRDGLIARHEDAFDLWRWSRMALGLPGALLGWTPMLRARIRRDALRGLDAYGRARSS